MSKQPEQRDEMQEALDALGVALVKAVATDLRLIIGFFCGVLFTCIAWGLSEVLQ